MLPSLPSLRPLELCLEWVFGASGVMIRGESDLALSHGDEIEPGVCCAEGDESSTSLGFCLEDEE